MRHLSIPQIREKLTNVRKLSIRVRQELENDPRKGVRQLLMSWERREDRIRQLLKMYQDMNGFERDLWTMGKEHVAGIDEAGRGPLAGPVVAACVILKPNTVIPGLNDSKQLTAARRACMYEQIRENAESIGIGIVSSREIDEINIYQAAKKAMILAVNQMIMKPDHLLIDAMELPLDIPQTSLIKGDARSNSIAAASIIAKVTRDRIMNDLDSRYPGYGFAVHKGYGTKEHLQAISRSGPCPEHRMTFAPLKNEWNT
ncbi:ribonuclease HII [Sporolactobacillus sp. THM7-4]|nr:ribonuclease HII [Sporolactobacillus sp. THM7-4]